MSYWIKRLKDLTMERILEAVNFINGATSEFKPAVGIILGTGLGGFVENIDVKYSIPYGDIPNMPVSTVEGHAGRLIFGTVGSVNVVAMQGRFHYYEGYDMKQVTFPVRVLAKLGIDYLFVSNASGGINTSFWLLQTISTCCQIHLSDLIWLSLDPASQICTTAIARQ